MTREEKIAILKDIINGEIINPTVREDIGEWAIRELEQKPKTDILDKMRTEFSELVGEYTTQEIWEIIDKYKEESEV